MIPNTLLLVIMLEFGRLPGATLEQIKKAIRKERAAKGDADLDPTKAEDAIRHLKYSDMVSPSCKITRKGVEWIDNEEQEDKLLDSLWFKCPHCHDWVDPGEPNYKVNDYHLPVHRDCYLKISSGRKLTNPQPEEVVA